MTPHLADTPVLETERLRLRAPAMRDWEAWRAFSFDDRSIFVRDPEMTEGKAWRGFAHVVGMWALRGYGSFVFTLHGDDRALGLTGPWHPMEWPEREIGWTVWTAEAEGKGLACEAATAARAYAYETLGWDGAVSYIDDGNDRSVRLAERMGAVRDPDAPTPKDDPAIMVYRHPGPEALK